MKDPAAAILQSLDADDQRARERLDSPYLSPMWRSEYEEKVRRNAGIRALVEMMAGERRRLDAVCMDTTGITEDLLDDAIRTLADAYAPGWDA